MSGAGSAIAGVGHTPYGKLPEVDAYELGLWALKDAIGDAGLGFEDIDGLIVNRDTLQGKRELVVRVGPRQIPLQFALFAVPNAPSAR